jgi:2-octaprenyl-6-methoxyphenol hydroxylase
LVIGADGRKSMCRDAAGIGIETRSYPQSALTLAFTHTRPHRDTSTEFHTASGPFTLVPLPGNRSSLVWVLDPGEAEMIDALSDEALSLKLERRSQSILGKITVEPSRGLFPLTMSRAKQFAANRIALVGEAAHVLPPIGAQGLNLGLRDAAAIGEIVIEASRRNEDVGCDNVLNDYDRVRRADVGSRALAVDLLNRSLLSDFLPVQSARGLGLYMLDRIGPLRRAVMREGTAPAGNQPKLMRGELL